MAWKQERPGFWVDDERPNVRAYRRMTDYSLTWRAVRDDDVLRHPSGNPIKFKSRQAAIDALDKPHD